MIAILSALAEPTRLAAMQLLWDQGEQGDHCACELMERLGATQSRVSRHMQVLQQAGLVVSRRQAQWVRYRINPDLPESTRQVVAAVMAATAEQERVAA